MEAYVIVHRPHIKVGKDEVEEEEACVFPQSEIGVIQYYITVERCKDLDAMPVHSL